MITFKEFLLQEDHSSSELVQLLEKDCVPFFTESKKQGLLLRGMRDTKSYRRALRAPDGSEVTFMERSVRKDRAPSDTNISTHNKLNRWFQAHFNIKARSEAVFCFGDTTASLRVLQQYGDPYVIFPIGEFKYVWSPLITDLYDDTAGIDFDEEDLDEFMTKKLYTDKRLDAAVKARNEIMIDCARYYAFSHSWAEELKRWLGIA